MENDGRPAYKFQELRVYQMALEYVDMIYDLSAQLPQVERFNLRSQLRRAATSIPLNIAEGSTGHSDAEQARFLSHAARSYLETVACLDLIERLRYVPQEVLHPIRTHGHQLFVKIQAFKKHLLSRDSRLPVPRPPSPVRK